MNGDWGGGDIQVSAFRRYPWWRGKGVFGTIRNIAVVAFLAGMIAQCQVSGEQDTQQKLQECRAELQK